MCGIGGIINFCGEEVSGQKLLLMSHTLRHRGPDGNGHWMNPEKNVGIFHRRLAIIDLSVNGNQPMHYLSRYSIVYNGEIYNYIEIRQELEKKGILFNSLTDTEMILVSYHLYGINCLKSFNGMFAFAIWDNENRTLFCARDRFGEKPFYYHYFNGEFKFASEMKALFAAGVSNAVNQEMLFLYLKWDVVENPEKKSDTFYNNIKKLPAAHYLLLTEKSLSVNRYWDIDLNKKQESIHFNEAVDQYRSLFLNSVKIRLRSDVPVGSSLSGGLDSSSVVMAINQLKGNQHKQAAFSARFREPEFDEGFYINELCNKTNIASFNTYPSESSFLDQIEKIFYHQEEPFGSASIIAQWEVMKSARHNNFPVLLDGQGADEILAGYKKYQQVYLRECFLNRKKMYREEKKALKEITGINQSTGFMFVTESFSPWLLRSGGKIKRFILSNKENKVFHPEFLNHLQNQSPPFRNFNSLNQTLYYDTVIYGLEKLLRFSDRNAMAFGVEVRLPYLDHNLVEFVFSLPSSFKIQKGYSKYLHRQAMANIIPDIICWRKDKLSFQVPQKKWFEHSRVKELLQDSVSTLKKDHILSKDAVIDPWRSVMSAFLLKNNFQPGNID